MRDLFPAARADHVGQRALAEPASNRVVVHAWGTCTARSLRIVIARGKGSLYDPRTMPRQKRRAGDPTRAVGYLRVSTEEQHLGPEAQRAAITAWATRAKVSVVAWHTDQGVSGSTEIEDRPGLLAALRDLAAQNAGWLAIAKRDRLARDTAIASLAEREVARAGARIASADGSGNGDGAADALQRALSDAVAAYELAMIRGRTKAALKAKRARGERAGNVPWGYRADDAGRLHENPEEQAVMARARALRGEGLGLAEIGEILADEGHLNRRGRPFDPATLSRWFRPPPSPQGGAAAHDAPPPPAAP